MTIVLKSMKVSTPPASSAWSDRLLELMPKSPYGLEVSMILPKAPPSQVTLVCLGEAPGKTEVERNEFFVGEAGKLLREILESEEVLDQTYFTNTSFWRPPKNPGTQGDERPGIQVIRDQRARLLFELAETRPRAIIALGQSAAQGIVPASPFHRGVVECIVVAGREIPVYLTWHPAYVFREPKFYSDIVRDIQRALRGEIPREAETDYEPVVPVSPILMGRYAVIDIETTNTSATSDIVCVAVRDAFRTYLFTAEDLPRLRESLAGFRGRLVAHNAKFDEGILRRHGVPVIIHHDSMLLHLSLDNRRGTHSLKTLSPVYGTRKLAEGLIAGTINEAKQNVWEDTPPDKLYAYCSADAVATWDTFTSLAKLSNTAEKRLYHFLRRAARPLAEGEQRGIMIDQLHLGAAVADYQEILQRSHDRFGFDPDSPKQVVDALQKAGYSVVSSAENILLRLDGPLPKQLLEYRGESKILSAFLEPLRTEWIGEDGACHPQILLHGTDTGRTSCIDPNLQQVPVELRGFFVPRPGHVFVGWDLVANEVRAIAVLSGDKSLIELLREGRDPHQVTADEIGVSRKQGKGFNFAAVYGAGINKLMDTLQVDRATVVRGLDIVNRLFPGLAAWKHSVLEQVETLGYVETPFGRRIQFPYSDVRTHWKIERQAVNSLPQSLGSDIGLISLIRAYELLGLVPLTFVHDSVLLEVEDDKSDQTIADLKEILQDLYPNPQGVVFEVEMKRGLNWRDMDGVG